MPTVHWLFSAFGVNILFKSGLLNKNQTFSGLQTLKKSGSGPESGNPDRVGDTAAGAGSFDSGGYGWQEIKMSTSTTTLFFPYKNTKAHIALKNVPQAQQEPLDAE